MKSIVVGSDGSPSAEAAVRRAVEIAKGSGAVVHLVTAYPDVPAYSEPISSSAKRDPINLHEVAESVLARAASELASQGVEVETYAQEGDPANVIIEVAQRTERRPHRRWRQGTYGPPAFPAGQRVQQALAPRTVQRDDRAGRRVARQRLRAPTGGRTGAGASRIRASTMTAPSGPATTGLQSSSTISG